MHLATAVTRNNKSPISAHAFIVLIVDLKLPVKIHGRPLSSWKTIISKMYEFLPTLGLILRGFGVFSNVSYVLRPRHIFQWLLHIYMLPYLTIPYLSYTIMLGKRAQSSTPLLSHTHHTHAEKQQKHNNYEPNTSPPKRIC